MADIYDTIVIGAGAGGLAAARAARGHGRVALVEAGRPGGDCTFTGCVPSKSLLEIAGRVAAVSDAEHLGLKASIEVDFDIVMQRIDSIIEEIAMDESPEKLRSEGIEFVEGRASFIDEHAIEVEGSAIRSDSFVIAVGSRPALPPVPGLDSADPLTNETIFELREAPAKLLLLGGGAVGCELAQALARLGVSVHMFEAKERILADEEPETSSVIADSLREVGVEISEDSTVTEAAPGVLRLEGGQEIRGSHLLVATGRRPDTDGIGLERAGVEVGSDGVIVTDDRSRTTKRHIYAIGDCAGHYRFTHVADEQGRRAVADLYSRFPRKTKESVVPRVIFTEPEVGRVGMTERQAYERFGNKARVALMPIDKTDRGRLSDKRKGFIKLIAAPRRAARSLGGGKLVGMTAVSESGGELIAEGALAMRTGALAGRLAQTIHAYPTWSLGVRQAAAQWFVGLDRPARDEQA